MKKKNLVMVEGFDGYFDDWIKSYIEDLRQRHS